MRAPFPPLSDNCIYKGHNLDIHENPTSTPDRSESGVRYFIPNGWQRKSVFALDWRVLIMYPKVPKTLVQVRETVVSNSIIQTRKGENVNLHPYNFWTHVLSKNGI